MPERNNLKINSKKRMIILFAVIGVAFVLLLFRVAWVQTVKSKWLQELAYESQTRDRTISSKRGTIYSSDGNILAMSVSVETISVTPAQIKEHEAVAKKLSEVLTLDYDEVYKKINSKQSLVTIKKNVEKSKADIIRKWIIDNEYEGIKIDESVARVYPNNNLASHVVGFVGTDSQGLYGIEKSYDDVLTGVPGRIISETDGRGNTIPFSSESYYAAKNGQNITLSIDSSIQYFTEKHLEKAVIDNECAKGGVAIVMKPSTGDVLAMAVKPDYDLNEPFGPYNTEQEDIWDTLTSSEKKTIRESMWRNMAVSDTYEPGSTFKIITASTALDLGLISESDRFTCNGHVTIGGARIRCWRYYRPHGVQTLTESLENSCNPAFISIGLKVGKESLYKYIEAFGLKEKTGIELPGEAIGIFHTLQSMGDVELATTAFGQRFQITPIGLVTAVSAVANDGKLMKPRIVKEIKDLDGNVVETIEPEVVRQVVSREVAGKVKNMMEKVVSQGTGGNAYIEGYDIGGKTGTGEQGIGANLWYVASFMGIAPVDNPEMVVLVALFDPKGASHGGGAIAAPVAKQIIEDSLRYLQIQPLVDSDATKRQNVAVPSVKDLTVEEAKKILTEKELNFTIEGSGEKVIDQIPKAGAGIVAKSKVILYTEENLEKVSVSVPSVIGKSVQEAKTLLNNVGLSINVNGLGVATSQDPVAGVTLQKGSAVNVEFKLTEVD